MNKQGYHKPVLKLYGNISAMTQNVGRTGDRSDNGGGDGNGNKTALLHLWGKLLLV